MARGCGSRTLVSLFFFYDFLFCALVDVSECGLLIVLLIALLVDDFADISWSLGGGQSVGF